MFSAFDFPQSVILFVFSNLAIKILEFSIMFEYVSEVDSISSCFEIGSGKSFCGDTGERNADSKEQRLEFWDCSS